MQQYKLLLARQVKFWLKLHALVSDLRIKRINCLVITPQILKHFTPVLWKKVMSSISLFQIRHLVHPSHLGPNCMDSFTQLPMCKAFWHIHVLNNLYFLGINNPVFRGEKFSSTPLSICFEVSHHYYCFVLFLIFFIFFFFFFFFWV